MNAMLDPDQVKFSLGNLSYIGPAYDEAAEPSVKADSHHGSGKWLSRLFAAVAEWHHRRMVIQEMSMMTDRELADIGLTRSDLPRVFDPAFAAEHARDREYMAY